MAEETGGRPSQPVQRKADLALEAQKAAAQGQWARARALFEQVIEADKRDYDSRFKLGLVLQRVGDLGGAAVRFSEVLRLSSEHVDAGQRLAGILALGRLTYPGLLDAAGLKAGLRLKGVDHQPIAEAALAHATSDGPLAEAMAAPDAEHERAAFGLIERRMSAALDNELFLLGLSEGVNRDLKLERLLTVLRRKVLLDLPEERLNDRALQAFLTALVRQLTRNEFIFAETSAESEALARLEAPATELASGSATAAVALANLALYRPIDHLLRGLSSAEIEGLKPRWLRDLAREELDAANGERRLAAKIPNLGPIADDVSRRVARQYEHNPYPRWRSLNMPQPLSGLRNLQRIASPAPMRFAQAPFDVLVAGAGTGREAIQAAVGYGPNARVLAIDLSLASLAYGQRMANRLGVDNLSFAQADLMSFDDGGRSFQIIEAVGVLHHMGDPIAGWRSLVERLAPGGYMLVGLYSAISREPILALGLEPDFPGAGCSDAEARAYRQRLIAQNPDIPGGKLARSKDFHTLSSFRDLVLHESEQPFTIPDIERALEKLDLNFLGFAASGFVRQGFAKAYPEEKWPGRFASWEAFEKANPGVFNAMYQFWCQKRPG
ncbi:MAG: methyltransferase domain-containing protein [Rhizobiales bacterium]|nr:methyltransferase domain-containing protein [Hyphomicrobiales bacterium]